MKRSASAAKLITTASGEEQTTAAGFDFAPEYAAELQPAEVSSAATAVPAEAGTSALEVSEVEARSWFAGTEASATLRHWTPILLRFTSIQVVVQAIGFAAGILVVRNLPKQEYAFYTLCNTMLATVLVLADGGISSALTAIGGRVWQDRGRLSQLLRTSLLLRRQMAAAAVPVVVGLLVWLLRRNGAPAGKIAVLVAIVLAGCGLELVTRIYVVALRLNSEIRQIQKQSLFAALLKFCLLAAAVALWFNVEFALLAVVAGFAVQYWMLRNWSRTHLDANATPDPEMRSEIVSVVRRQSPHSIYYCLQAQITVWLISVFGNADRVADVGALARLAVVFVVLGSLTSELVFPAFARIQNLSTLRQRYLQIVCGFAAVSGLLIGVVAIFPGEVLSVLGSRYSHLRTEGILMALNSVMGAMAGLTWGLNASRAWIISPVTFIPVVLMIQIGLIAVLDFATVRGVLLFSTVTALSGFVWSIGFALLRMRS